MMTSVSSGFTPLEPWMELNAAAPREAVRAIEPREEPYLPAPLALSDEGGRSRLGFGAAVEGTAFPNLNAGGPPVRC